jgi:hypothetical protein
MRRTTIRPKTVYAAICVLLFAYVGGYSALSACGEYQVRWSGRTRYAFGLAVADTAYWFPKGMESWERTMVAGQRVREASWLAKIYLPLVILDQRYIHRSQPLFTRPP